MQFAFAHVLRGEGKAAVAISDCAVERVRDLYVDIGYWTICFVEYLSLNKGVILCKGGHSERQKEEDHCPLRCGCGEMFHVCTPISQCRHCGLLFAGLLHVWLKTRGLFL